MGKNRSLGLLALAKNVNNFYLGNYKNQTFLPFICENDQVGLISPQVLDQLRGYPQVFDITKESVVLSSRLTSYDERSSALEKVLKDLQSKNMFVALNGWRDECYEIKVRFSGPALFKMERAATPLFGVRQFGVHINGFTHHCDKGLCFWLQRRSATKQTWPGRLDSFVGGGLSKGFGIFETAVKEANEEANVPEEISVEHLKSAGSVSFFHESERGIHPQTEFVFDLELPYEFQPANNDGEVSGWELVPLKDLVETIQREDFKTTSCPVVMDWLIRRGHVTAQTEPDFPELVEHLHLPLHQLYQTKE